MEARNKKIEDWFAMVKQGQMVLPRFQRHEAWRQSQISGLFENILRDPPLPIGALLTLEVGDKELFRSRPIVGAPQTGAKPAMHHVLDTMREDDRYADPDIRLQANPGEISPAALARLHEMVAEALSDADGFARWFGEFTTAPKNDQLDWSPDEPVLGEELLAAVASGAMLERNPASRFSFVRHEIGTVTLFVDGASHALSGPAAEFAERLCASSSLAVDAELPADPPAAALILDLLNRGNIALADSA